MTFNDFIKVKQKQVDNAMKLAEQYIDFATLVTICEIRSDTDLLDTYLDKFINSVFSFSPFIIPIAQLTLIINKKFAEFVVRHFMEKRKLNFLLKNQFLKRPDVSKSLDKYKYLSWIKDFKNDNYVQVIV